MLERAGLIRREISGRDHFLTVNVEPLIEASTWIEDQKTFWEGRLDALESFLQPKERKGPEARDLAVEVGKVSAEGRNVSGEAER